MLLAGAGCAAPSAAAQQLPSPVPVVRYEIGGWPDVAVTSAGVLLSVLPAFLSPTVASPCPCDPSDLPRIDRGAVGPVASGPSRWSDITIAATIGLAGAGVLLARPEGPWEDRAGDLAVLGQAVIVTNGITTLLKTVVARPRPFVYAASPTTPVGRDDVASFPSGHTSNAFAAAAAYWSILQRRGVAGRHTPEIVGLFALATAAAVLRVEAHKHFPTDVIGGAVLGIATGFAIPRLHAVH